MNQNRDNEVSDGFFHKVIRSLSCCSTATVISNDSFITSRNGTDSEGQDVEERKDSSQEIDKKLRNLKLDAKQVSKEESKIEKSESYFSRLFNSNNEENESETITKKQIPFEKQQTKYTKWSKKETELLTIGYEQFGGNWNKIKTIVDTNKIAQQCMNRAQQILGASKPDAWTDQQDKQVVKLYNQLGPNWTIISKKLGTKTSQQVKNRFNNYIKKHYSGSINQEFSEEDDLKLVELVQTYQQDWMQIKRHFIGKKMQELQARYNDLFQDQTMTGKSTQSLQGQSLVIHKECTRTTKAGSSIQKFKSSEDGDEDPTNYEQIQEDPLEVYEDRQMEVEEPFQRIDTFDQVNQLPLQNYNHEGQNNGFELLHADTGNSNNSLNFGDQLDQLLLRYNSNQSNQTFMHRFSDKNGQSNYPLYPKNAQAQGSVHHLNVQENSYSAYSSKNEGPRPSQFRQSRFSHKNKGSQDQIQLSEYQSQQSQDFDRLQNDTNSKESQRQQPAIYTINESNQE